MISTFLDRLWYWHDEVKDLFRLFTNPNKSNLVKEKVKQNDHSNDMNGDGNGEEHRFNRAKLIGLILGPALFFLYGYSSNQRGYHLREWRLPQARFGLQRGGLQRLSRYQLRHFYPSCYFL